jgi:hypothetical protein
MRSKFRNAPQQVGLQRLVDANRDFDHATKIIRWFESLSASQGELVSGRLALEAWN